MSLDRTMIFRDLKDMLKQTGEKYGEKTAYILQEGNERIKITHKQFREDINYLGTALIEMGLKDKRIAVIGENRYEWEVAYLAVTTGTGIVVPLDKALPENEIESLILRSEVEAIIYSNKYDDVMAKIQKQGNTKLKYFISMDLEKNEFNKYSFKEIMAKGKELLNDGNREFVDSKIDNEKMGIMLFTSGTTAMSKAVMLSHKNICTNVMDIRKIFELDETDTLLSFLPLHHTFECTVGFLYVLSIGATIVFSKGVRHIADELKEFKITAMICVPVVFEKMYQKLLKGIENKGKMATVKKGIKISNLLSKIKIDIRKKLFAEIHENLGGNIRLMVAGGAALNPEVEKGFNDLGFNLVQGYGLTETSPVIAAELTHQRRLGSIGKKFPSVEVKLDDIDPETGVGELLAKGDSIMLGYYNNEEANKETFTEDGWLRTGDYAKIDKDGYIFISGRKKFVIVLQNGKNVYPEEIETLISNSPLVSECMVYGDYKNDRDVTIGVKVVYDKEYINEKFGNITEEQIRDMIWKEIKVVNRTMPKYKWVKKLLITDQEFEKTTTHKIKRKIETDKILQG
ncbi:MAG: AMP-binding protein [Clostridia bacterium]|nr:AMP-binding protein [Clostridia bacterium]